MRTEMGNMSRKEAERPALQRGVEPIPDLVGWLANRDTIRRFDPDVEIADAELRELVDAGRKAPTSGTIQMYSFVRVSNPETRARIHELCARGTDQIEECSEFLVVCIDMRRVKLLHDHRDIDFHLSPLMGVVEGTIDAALATEGIMVAAESRDYGVCPIGNILTSLDAIAEVIDLPAGVLPLFGLCIGAPIESDVRGCPRVPLDAVLHEETYEDPDEDLLEACFAAMDERYADQPGRDWAGTLVRYWGPDGFMNEREPVLQRALRQQGFFAYDGVEEAKTADSAQDPGNRWG